MRHLNGRFISVTLRPGTEDRVADAVRATDVEHASTLQVLLTTVELLASMMVGPFAQSGGEIVDDDVDERHAIVFGRASSCSEPVLVRPNDALKSPGSS